MIQFQRMIFLSHFYAPFHMYAFLHLFDSCFRSWRWVRFFPSARFRRRPSASSIVHNLVHLIAWERRSFFSRLLRLVPFVWVALVRQRYECYHCSTCCRPCFRHSSSSLSASLFTHVQSSFVHTVLGIHHQLPLCAICRVCRLTECHYFYELIEFK